MIQTNPSSIFSSTNRRTRANCTGISVRACSAGLETEGEGQERRPQLRKTCAASTDGTSTSVEFFASSSKKRTLVCTFVTRIGKVGYFSCTSSRYRERAPYYSVEPAVSKIIIMKNLDSVVPFREAQHALSAWDVDGGCRCCVEGYHKPNRRE